MKKFLAKQIRRVAPTTVSNLRRLAKMDPALREGPARFLAYERELRGLRREIDELRRDNRRVAELYDAVFHWARVNAATPGSELVDPPPVRTVDRVGKVAAERSEKILAEDA